MKGARAVTDDNRIIEMFFERSEQAIGMLSEKYGALCTRVAENVLTSEEDAEECVSDAFLAVWNKIPPERPDPLSAYVCRIVKNLALKKLRQNTAAKRSAFETAIDELEEHLSSGENVEAECDERELTELLNRFLADLPERERVLFVRRYWFGDSMEALAELFGTTEHNITARLYRTRQKLKKYLQKEGVQL